MKIRLALLLALFGVLAGFGADAPATPITVPTAAVLPFEARGRQPENSNTGKSVAELVSVALQESDVLELVERAELDKALDELQLSAVGLTDPRTQLKLGRLAGAKILITGSAFRSEDKNYLVAKVIGTETSRVRGCSVSGKADFTELAPELAAKIAELCKKHVTQLLPSEATPVSVAAELKEAVQGKGRKVCLLVRENISVAVPDPAAETELKKLLVELGFEVVTSRKDADFTVVGEAIAATAGTYRHFTGAAARVELSVYGKEDKLLSSGAAKDTQAGATYILAAKEAIAQATLRLAADTFRVMK